MNARLGRKAFFFEKKKQKTFDCLVRAHVSNPTKWALNPNRKKFFGCCFFSKSSGFLSGLYQTATRLTDRQQERTSFLKKRSKRLLPIGTRVAATRTYYNQKFFGSFFQKRTAVFLARAASLYPSRKSHPLPGLVLAGENASNPSRLAVRGARNTIGSQHA